MELRHLKYFVSIAQEGSFSAAAAKLYISQPTLSRQIKDLEKELGADLFIRQSNGLKLTHAGETFLEHAKDILHRSHVALEKMDALSLKSTEPLVIGYIPTILESFLGKALQRLAFSYPEIPIRFQEMSPNLQVKALRDRDIDIAFMGNPAPDLESEFIVKSVKQVPIMALLPEMHPYASLESIDLAVLTGEKFIGMSEATFPGRNARICDVCCQAGFTPHLHLLADSHASMISLVATGQGVAIMPKEAQALPHPGVVFIPLHHPIYFARSTAVWRKEVPTSSLDKFLQILFEDNKA